MNDSTAQPAGGLAMDVGVVSDLSDLSTRPSPAFVSPVRVRVRSQGALDPRTKERP